jgi:chloride channel protein, CIC family
MTLDAFLRLSKHDGKVRHVVVTRDETIFGVLRINTGLHHGLEGISTGVKLEDVASRNFTIAHAEDVMFGVIGRMWQAGAIMAVVIDGNGGARTDRVLGVITKEDVADSVSASVQPFLSGNS